MLCELRYVTDGAKPWEKPPSTRRGKSPLAPKGGIKMLNLVESLYIIDEEIIDKKIIDEELKDWKKSNVESLKVLM